MPLKICGTIIDVDMKSIIDKKCWRFAPLKSSQRIAAIIKCNLLLAVLSLGFRNILTIDYLTINNQIRMDFSKIFKEKI